MRWYEGSWLKAFIETEEQKEGEREKEGKEGRKVSFEETDRAHFFRPYEL